MKNKRKETVMKKWLKILLTVAEWVVPFLAKAGKNKQAEKLENATKVADIVMEAIEKTGAKNVKEVVKTLAANEGIKDIVHTWAKRVETKVKAKLGL